MEPELKKGRNGIFEVAVEDRVVAKKTFFGFPTERDIVDAVAKEIGATA